MLSAAIVHSAKLSAALYCTSKTESTVRAHSGGMLSKLATHWATSYAIVDDRNRNERRIALRGAAWNNESVSAFDLWRSLNDALPARIDSRVASVAHRGLLSIAHDLFDELQPYIEYAPSGTVVRLTGHSAGGSLALLVALVALSAGIASAGSLRVDAFGSPSVLGCEPEGEGGNALLAHGMPERNVHWLVLGNDPVARFWLEQDPFWRILSQSPFSGLLNARRALLRRPSLFTSSRFLYEACGQLVLLDEHDDGSVTAHNVNAECASQQLHPSELGPATLQKAIAQHSAWRYARVLEHYYYQYIAHAHVPPVQSFGDDASELLAPSFG